MTTSTTMLHIRCQYAIVLGLLTISSLLTSTESAAGFVNTPANPLYVVRGRTARFVWTYHVDDRNKEFNPVSPIWFYNNSIDIGGDNGFLGWSFQLFNKTCPRRLLSPTLRVSRVDQATLVIKDVVPADTGTYGCRLALRSGSDITSTVELIVTETPRFVVAPNFTTPVIEGMDLRLPCTAVGPPTPNVTWFNITSNTKLFEGKGSVVLSIKNVKRNQNGKKYKCQAVNNPNQGPVTATTTVVVYFAPGQPSISITNIEASLVTITWTKPLENGGSPITGYRIIISYSVIHDVDSTTMSYTISTSGLAKDTEYVVQVYAKNIAGYGTATSTTFRTKKQGPPSSRVIIKSIMHISIPLHVVRVTSTIHSTTSFVQTKQPSIKPSAQASVQDVVIGAWLGTSLLIISLIVNVLFVVYFCRNKDRLRKKQESTYDDVEMRHSSALNSHVNNMAETSLNQQTSPVYEPVAQPNTKQFSPHQPTRPNHQGIPNQQATYAIPGNPGNQQTSQDHYQQLDPATLQHEPTVQYEPLRIKHATGTDSRNDTYEPLRNIPVEYQSLQKYSNVNNTSFS